MDDLAKCYQVLGLKEGCSAAELDQAYQDRAEAWQPENFSHNEQLLARAREKLQHVQSAYEILRVHLSGNASREPDEPGLLTPEWPRNDPAVEAFPAEEPVSAGRRIAVWAAWGVVLLLLIGSAWLVFFNSSNDTPPPVTPEQGANLSGTNTSPATNGIKQD